MFDLPGPLGTFANFLVIVLGFGSIIFIHELGHFVAAKWAGIRVLAFSIGFGNVLVSYRKGIGFRKGSSDAEYRKLVYGSNDSDQSNESNAHPEISPTEYRLSMLPLGGYVKMLGQEDINPQATSDAPDSYQNCPVGKRMVVICAGVVMNMIMAAALFIVVFFAGLAVSPPIVGYVADDSPAAQALAINQPDLPAGIRRDDRIISIGNNKVYSFEAILPEIAMGSSAKPTTILIEREGIAEPIEFQATPAKGRIGLLEIGISAAISPRIKSPSDEREQRMLAMFSKASGFDQIEPGDEILSANAQPVRSPFDLLDMATQSDGQPMNLLIDRDAQTIEQTLLPVPALQTDPVQVADAHQVIRHILGLSGVMMVNPAASPDDTKQGLEPGDIFAKIGTIEYPSVPQGIAFVQANAGKDVELVVLRKDDAGITQRIKLSVKITPEGTIGFYPTSTVSHDNLLSEPADFVKRTQSTQSGEKPEFEHITMPASGLIQYPGSRLIKVGDIQISTLRDVPQGILKSIEHADPSADEANTYTIPLTLELPLPIQPDGSIPTTTIDWTLTQSDIDTVEQLGWTLPGSLAVVDLFDPVQVIDKADSSIGAISRGISESRRVMLQTYITFLRLFEGSVKVEHLKGPVGIAHIGTQFASRGWVWVLFFMALISVNLAVINFLPLPIVDGGQFLMLVYEWLRGKPVPIVVQNVATMAGLLMIGTIFLYVTFNDVKALFGL